MKLQSLLNEDLIFLRTQRKSKEESIKFLLSKIIDRFELSSRTKELEELVLARESLGGTTFPSGLAVPHARIPNFNDLIIAIDIPQRPFLDNGIEVTMVAMILTAETNPTMYLNTLSSFVKMSTKPDTFQKLITARNPDDFVKVVEEQNFSVKKDILVGDLMSPATFTVKITTPLKLINDILFENKFSYLPVINDNDEFIGEIRLLEIIDLGIPEYAKELGSLKFTTSLEAFEKLLENEGKYCAKDVMKKPVHTLTPKSALLEASMAFIKTKERQLPVMDGKKIVGVLSYMDIFNKIFRS